jgi:predicted DsbA family dithiol-disulfide isomerase
MKIEIWSDIACPWCYIGKRRLERALRRVLTARRSRSPGAASSAATLRVREEEG